MSGTRRDDAGRLPGDTRSGCWSRRADPAGPGDDVRGRRRVARRGRAAPGRPGAWRSTAAPCPGGGWCARTACCCPGTSCAPWALPRPRARRCARPAARPRATCRGSTCGGPAGTGGGGAGGRHGRGSHLTASRHRSAGRHGATEPCGVRPGATWRRAGHRRRVDGPAARRPQPATRSGGPQRRAPPRTRPAPSPGPAIHVSSSSPSGQPATQPRGRRRGLRGAYRLVRTPPGRVAPPVLDAAQRAVVDHRHGPLLVLAGPGTGKTTTLVEAVAARVAGRHRPRADPRPHLQPQGRGGTARPDGRAARRGAARRPQATTFHSFCYALVRAHQDADLFADPLRLLSGPEQDVAVRELLAGRRAGRDGPARVRWPDELRACLTTRGFADEVRAVLARSRELGLGPDALAAFARPHRPPRLERRGRLPRRVPRRPGRPGRAGLRGAGAPRGAARRAHRTSRRSCAARVRRGLRRRVPGHRPRPGAAAAGARRRTAATLVAFGDPDQSIYAFRGADVNGILDFPEAFPRADGTPAPVAGARHLPPLRRRPARGHPAAHPPDAAAPGCPPQKVRAHREPARRTRDGGRVEVYTYPTAGAELDNIADILRRAHLEDGVPWREMAVLVRAGGRTHPRVRRALTSAGVPLEIDGDDLPLRHEPAVAPLLTALRAVRRRGRRRPDRRLDAEATVGERTPPPGRPLRPVGRRRRGRRPPTAVPPPRRRRPLARRRDRPRPCSPPRSAAWTPPICAGSGRALREEERAAGQRAAAALRRAARRGRSPSRSAWSRTTPRTPAAPSGSALLLRKARELLAGGGTAEEALWELWDGTPWPQRLERAARRGGAGRPQRRPRPRRRRAPCSRPPPAPRSAPAAAAPSTSWRSSTPRTSPPTPSPAAPCAPTPYG